MSDGKRKIICVNRAALIENREEGNTDIRPVAICDPETQTFEVVHGVEIDGPSRLVYDPEGFHIPGLGAYVYIETDAPVREIPCLSRSR